MKKEKNPGRVTLICDKCEAKFSTHSTNRTKCHNCKPKCREIHYFNQPIADTTAKDF